MAIWFELMALSLAAYAVGLLFGWLVWGDVTQPSVDEEAQIEPRIESKTKEGPPEPKTRSTT